MPLRAILDEEDIISIELNDERWDEIKDNLKAKKNSLKLPCCNQDSFLRISRNGLKHFVHAKSNNSCDWKPESPEHLKAKLSIVEACKKSGWNAIPEFSENDWRADVMAIKGDLRIAFEVQWSRQSFVETMLRQERYQKSGVRGCWFFRSIPKEMRNYDSGIIANNNLPTFKISKDENSDILAELNEMKFSLTKVVEKLLTRKVKHCNNMRVKPRQLVTIVVFDIVCWKCGKGQHCYTVENDLKTVCDQKMPYYGAMWDDNDLDKLPEIYSAVQLIAKQETNLKIGKLKKRYSHTTRSSYVSHGCYFCDAIFGDFHLNDEKLDAHYDKRAKKFVKEVELKTLLREEPHWCYSEQREFCEQN